MSAINMVGFTAGFSLYRSSQYYLMTRSAGSIGNSGRTVTPQQSIVGPPCTSPLGSCYTAPDGSLLSICPCGSPGTCGPCFDLSVEGVDLGNKHICLCESENFPCCPPSSRFAAVNVTHGQEEDFSATGTA
jgi:hypothetical protein